MKIVSILFLSLILFAGVLFTAERLLPDHLFFQIEPSGTALSAGPEFGNHYPAASPGAGAKSSGYLQGADTRGSGYLPPADANFVATHCPLDGQAHLSWKAQINQETGAPETYWLLPVDWTLDGSKFRGPQSEKIVVSASKFFQGEKAPSVEQLIAQKVVPMMEGAKAKVHATVDLPEVARNLATLAGNPGNGSFFAKGIRYDFEGKSGLSVVTYGLKKGEGREEAFYQITDFSAQPEVFEAGEAHFLHAMRNLTHTPPLANTTAGINPEYMVPGKGVADQAPRQEMIYLPGGGQ